MTIPKLWHQLFSFTEMHRTPLRQGTASPTLREAAERFHLVTSEGLEDFFCGKTQEPAITHPQKQLTLHAKAASKGSHLPQVSQAVVSWLSVRGANHLDSEHGLQLPQLQQHDGQVVDEEQGIHQGHSILHYPLVVGVLRVQDANAVKEPVGKHKEENEDQQKGPKHKHPR